MSKSENILILKKAALMSLKNSEAEIVENFEKYNLNASERTIKSLSVFEDGDNIGISGRSYFETSYTGRKAGNVPPNFSDIIKQWIIDKGISVSPLPYKRKKSANWSPMYTPQERGVNMAAGAIAYTIGKKGSYRKRKNESLESVFNMVLDSAVSGVSSDLSDALFKITLSLNYGGNRE